jgi:MarR family transcriptional regulator for hemolysin
VPPELTAVLGRQINLAAKATRQWLDRNLAAAGGGYVTWTILRVLVQEETLIQRALAERLSVEGPTLTHHLARMEREGLVARQRLATDRRATLVELTDHGRELYERLAKVVFSSNQAVVSGLTAEQVAQVNQTLAAIVANCDNPFSG